MAKQVYIPWKTQHLAATIDYPLSYLKGGNNSYPIIIICHGFTGNRIGIDRLFVKTANELNLDHFIVLRFDYHGCGESIGQYGETGLDELINQTEAAIDFATSIEGVDASRLFLLGHSLGGATALLTAIKDHRVKELILWSAVANPYKDITNIVGTQKVQKLNDVTPIDHIGYRLSKRFFDSLSLYNPLKALKDFTGNVLIVHGTNDEDIPVKYSEDYEREFLNGSALSCKNVQIQGANHTYSCCQHFTELITVTREWLKNFSAVTN